MTAVLIDHLPLVSSSENGVQKLRDLILQLAVRGKLLTQNASDEPATQLLRKLQAEKARLVTSNAIRKEKQLPPISPDDHWCRIPRSWSWVRLGEIGDWGAGATPLRGNPKYYGGNIPWFKSGELSADVIYESEEKITDIALKECSLRENKIGDVLVAMYGATIGKTAMLGVPGTTNQAVCACTPFSGMNNQFLLVLLKAMKPFLVKQGAGGAQPNISREKIIATIVPLPPLAEQERIVAKVDELMILCDRLESKQQEEKLAHSLLVSIVLSNMVQAKGLTEFDDRWALVKDNFDALFTNEASVDALKGSLVQLAVTGKLVPQNCDAEPADHFLKHIENEPTLLKKAARVSELQTSPKLFEEPPKWMWTRFDNIVTVSSGVTLGKKLEGKKTIQMPYLRVANVQRGFLVLDDIKEISIEPAHVEKYLLKPGDLLLTEGGDWDKVGRTTIWRGEIDRCLHQNHIFKARPRVTDLDVRWAELYLNSTVARQYFASCAKQTTNLASINMTQLRNCPFPLPPVEEQRRIVDKVKELLSLCDQFKLRLCESLTHKEVVSQTLINQALSSNVALGAKSKEEAPLVGV